MKKFKPFNLEDVSKEELYENLQRCISEKIAYWNRINRAIEELELWEPKIEALKIEKDYLLDVLKGKDDYLLDIKCKEEIEGRKDNA